MSLCEFADSTKIIFQVVVSLLLLLNLMDYTNQAKYTLLEQSL